MQVTVFTQGITSSCGGLGSGNTSLHIREPVDSFLSGVLSGVLDRNSTGTSLARSPYLSREVTSSCNGAQGSCNTLLHIREKGCLSGVHCGMLDPLSREVTSNSGGLDSSLHTSRRCLSLCIGVGEQWILFLSSFFLCLLNLNFLPPNLKTSVKENNVTRYIVRE